MNTGDTGPKYTRPSEAQHHNLVIGRRIAFRGLPVNFSYLPRPLAQGPNRWLASIPSVVTVPKVNENLEDTSGEESYNGWAYSEPDPVCKG